MQPRWTSKEIKAGLVDAAASSIKACHKAFHQVSADRSQGLEKIFDDEFCKQLRKFDGWKVDNQVSRSKINTSRNASRPSGWIDAIARHESPKVCVGIEFKVCRFPRLRNTSPKGGIYDVEQIAWDFGALQRDSGRIDFAYCIVVLFGGFVEAEGLTGPNLMRYFHNEMYADFQASLLWGYYNKELRRADPRRKRLSNDWDKEFIKRVVRSMGLDKPYNRTNASKMNFCVLDPKRALAVIGFCAKMDDVRASD
jgi:hypothetical protein